MNLTSIKKEQEVQLVKIEEPSEQEVTTVVLENYPAYEEVQHQIISSEDLPHILKNYGNANVEGNTPIVQLQDGQYTYIIQNPESFEAGTQFQLADGEHYIIEEYQEEYEEVEEPQFQTVYIQSMDSPNRATEIYTISEEVHEEYVEESNDAINDEVENDDDEEQQMAIVEEPEEYVHEEKPSPSEKVPVKIKQVLKSPATSESHVIKQECPQPVPQHDHSDTESVDGLAVQLKSDRKPSKTEIMLVYECDTCSRTFRTPMAVKRHISISHLIPDEQRDGNKDILSFSLCPCCGEPSDTAHTTGDFSCDKCSKLFILQNSLDRHRSIEHPVGDSYECVDCKRVFLKKEHLIDHTRVHSLKAVKCEDCGREFSRKYHLDRHIGQTGCMGLPKQVYECWVCNKTFTRKDNLGEHLKGHAGIMNKRNRHSTCEFCSKVFSGAALLQIHIRTHTGERPYGCDICEKKFPSSGAMKKHRRKHTGEKPYTCPQCGVKFAAKETLNRHWRTHTGEKPHQCKFCGKAFIQAAQLRAHIFHHTGENAFTCPHCNRAFNRKLRLTTHIKYMHEGAEPLPCPQEGCDKTFFRKEDIHRHALTHSGERPFKCDVCQKAFAVKSSLKIHQNIHKKEAPVSCEVCSRAFIRKDCLMRHMRARHRDVLEDIVANAEKKRLQTQLFRAVSSAANKEIVKDTIVWNELTLTESIKELLTLLVDEDCLKEFGHPEAPVDRVLESVIRRCGHKPASETDFDYIGKMRENTKLLFTVVIDDKAVKELLNNQTVDEVIMHVLKLAKQQANGTLIEVDEDEEDIKVKSSIPREETEEGNTNEEIDEGEADEPASILGIEEDVVEYVVEEAENEQGMSIEDATESEAVEDAGNEQMMSVEHETESKPAES